MTPCDVHLRSKKRVRAEYGVSVGRYVVNLCAECAETARKIGRRPFRLTTIATSKGD